MKEQNKKKVEFKSYCDADNKAGVVLADILNTYDDEHLSARTQRYIHLFYNRLKALNKIDGITNKRYYYHSLYKNTMESIENTDFPQNVKNFTKNLLTGVSREYYENNLKK